MASAPTEMTPPKRKRVAIVGAGAAGMAAAWSLSRFPDEFEVDVIEPGEVAGGVACTLQHDGLPVNYGVQGGSPAAHQNTVEIMRAFGVEVAPTKLDVSFGVGGYNWKNYEAKPLQQRLAAETRRFGAVLKWLSCLEFVSIFVSIDWVLRVLRFSEEFRHRMVYPLVALFFGTGNQTPLVSSAIIARVFLDKSLAIFDYDPDYLLKQTPTNIAFDDLQAFYATMVAQISADHCRFHFCRRATALQRDGGTCRLIVDDAPPTWRGGSDQLGGEYPIGGGGERCSAEFAAAAAAGRPPPRGVHVREYDEVILACPADAARALLGDGATRAERSVLGGVRYFHDLTVTHTDEEYMRRHNEVDGRAIYFIKSGDERPDELEMGFELTAYQPALAPRREAIARGDGGAKRIYQTIYLDRARSERWTIGELKPECVIDRAWWSAFSHTYEHFRRVVPWVWSVQGTAHTWYAGSWTLFNTHDIAISSGLAVAHRMGAPYPFAHNPVAAATFDTVLAAGHLRPRSADTALAALSALRPSFMRKDRREASAKEMHIGCEVGCPRRKHN